MMGTLALEIIVTWSVIPARRTLSARTFNAVKVLEGVIESSCMTRSMSL